MTTATASQQYELTYWPIRGLGAICRAALIASDIPFKDNRMLDWFGAEGVPARSKAFHEVNPLANLPSLTLPSGQIVSQSIAVLSHIGRVGSLKPHNEADAARIDEVIQTLVELQAEKIKMSYGPTAKDNAEGFFSESIPYFYGILEKYVEKNKTKFLAADYLTIADLYFTEQLAGLNKFKGNLDWAAKYPRLVEIYKAVLAHPKLAAYYEAEKDVPFNNPNFGAWH